MIQQTLMERAFALAGSGSCRNVADIEKRLSAEGFSSVQMHLAGGSLRKQLMALCRRAKDVQPDNLPLG